MEAYLEAENCGYVQGSTNCPEESYPGLTTAVTTVGDSKRDLEGESVTCQSSQQDAETRLGVKDEVSAADG